MRAHERLCRRTYMFSDGRQRCWIHRSFRLVRVHVSQRVCVKKLWMKARLRINYNEKFQKECLCLGITTSLCVKPLAWKRVPLSCSFSCKSNSCIKTRFETEAQGKLKKTRKWTINLNQKLTTEQTWNTSSRFFCRSYFKIARDYSFNTKRKMKSTLRFLSTANYYWFASYNILHTHNMKIGRFCSLPPKSSQLIS